MDLETLNPTLYRAWTVARNEPGAPGDYPWEPFDPAEIAPAEASLGLRFPPDYIEFLVKYGRFQIYLEDYSSLCVRAVYKNGTSCNEYVGVIVTPATMVEAHTNFLDQHDYYDACIPPSLLPLTYNAGYGHAMMDASPEHFGRILFLESRQKTFGTPGYGWDQVGFVANSFLEFVAMIGTKAELRARFGPLQR